MLVKGRRQPPAGLLHLTSRGTAHPGDANPRGGRRGARRGGRGRRGTRRRGRRTPRGSLASGAVPQRKPAVDGGISPQLLALAAVNAGSGAATTFLTDSAEDRDVGRREVAVS
ncbi:hypothetical protein ACQ4PT_001729 [Festuca glaucescens]